MSENVEKVTENVEKVAENAENVENTKNAENVEVKDYSPTLNIVASRFWGKNNPCLDVFLIFYHKELS